MSRRVSKRGGFWLQAGLRLRDRSLCLQGIRGLHFRTARLTCGYAPLAERLGKITAHELRHSAATILLNHGGKGLREIQELLRHKTIRTTVLYTHVGYEQTLCLLQAALRAASPIAGGN
jgi:integrase